MVLVLTLFMAAALPADSCELSSARLGNALIKVGDSERAVVDLSPDRRVRLENRFGAAAGVRYEFHRRGKTVEVFVRGGRIVRICHIND